MRQYHIFIDAISFMISGGMPGIIPSALLCPLCRVTVLWGERKAKSRPAGKGREEDTMDQFFTVLTQIGIFLILIALGVLAVKVHILDEHSLGSISKVIMRMALPAYIFINTAEGATRAGLASSLMVIPLAIALYLLLFLLSLALERIFHLSGNRQRVFRAIVMFGNVGFMGIPLVVELYPDTALLYISLFTILDQILFWTVWRLADPAGGGGAGETAFFARRPEKSARAPP